MTEALRKFWLTLRGPGGLVVFEGEVSGWEETLESGPEGEVRLNVRQSLDLTYQNVMQTARVLGHELRADWRPL